MDKRLVSELLKTRKSVKRKYQSLKSDIAKSQLALEKQFKPISEPLRELLSTIKTEGSTDIKTKVETPQRKTMSSSSGLTTSKSTGPKFLSSTVIGEIHPEMSVSSDDEDENGEQYEPTMIKEVERSIEQMMRPEVLDKYLEQFKGLARTYITDMIRDTDDAFDMQYGVRFDLNEDAFHIGNKKLEFEGEDMYIMDGPNKVVYKATPGFYELMFKKKPTVYTKKDADNYADVVQRSSANRKNYEPEGPISGNVGPKYTKVIRPLMTSKVPHRGSPLTTSKLPRRGTGLLTVNDKKVEFIPWKNPNTLVDRLRILMASQFAGHTGHSNEITRIIDTLKKYKYIK